MRTMVVILMIAFAFGVGGCATGKNPWAQVTTPTLGEAAPIGTYTAGCLAGATTLPPDGPGFQLMRLTRGKFYGHPRLIEFIRELGARTARAGHGQILVGNLGQPRGGPTLVGHKSHQNGLDVDLWYWQPPIEYKAKGKKRAALPARPLTLGERESLESPSLLLPGGAALDPARYDDHIEARLKLASEMPDVERIFVNPVIKRHICAHAGGQAWLAKLRPWWGHDDHFHVRLKCPEGASLCVAQEAVPTGDGCDSTLDWWFTAEALKEAADMAKEPPKPAAMPKLPEACGPVLGG